MTALDGLRDSLRSRLEEAVEGVGVVLEVLGPDQPTAKADGDAGKDSAVIDLRDEVLGEKPAATTEA